MYSGVKDGFRTIKASEGLRGFSVVRFGIILIDFIQGWFPTLIGYSAQGFGKFGFYEIFKDVYRGVAGEKRAKKY